MANFGILAKLGVDTSNMKRGLDDAKKDADSFGKKLGKAVKAGALVAGAAIAAMATKGIKDFMNFEKKMAEVFTLMPDMSAEAQASMNEDMRELSKTMGVDLTDATNGLYQAISAGIDPDNAVTFLETASKAAIAGVSDLETSVGALTTILNGYGMEASQAEKVSDVLFSVVKIGVTNFDELGANIGKVTPLAAELGISIEEVGAMFATLTKTLGAGKTAEAGTQIRSMLAEMSKGGMKAFENFKEATGTTFPAFIKSGGKVKDALVLMSEHAEKSGKQLMDMFRGVEAGMGALTLAAEGGERFGNALKTIEGDSGSMLKAFATMEQTSAHQFNVMKRNFEDAGIAMGASLIPLVNAILPALTEAFEMVAVVVKKVTKFFRDSPKLVTFLSVVFKGLTGALVAYGTIAVAMAAKTALVSVAMRVAATATALFGKSVKTAGTAMKMSPIGAMITLLAGLAAAYNALRGSQKQASLEASNQHAQELKNIREQKKSAQDVIDRIREQRKERVRLEAEKNKEKEIRKESPEATDLEVAKELAAFRHKESLAVQKEIENRKRHRAEEWRALKQNNKERLAAINQGEFVSKALEKAIAKETKLHAELFVMSEQITAEKEKQKKIAADLVELEENIAKEVASRLKDQKEARDVINEARREHQLSLTEMGKALQISESLEKLERQRFTILNNIRAGSRGEVDDQKKLAELTREKLKLEKDLENLIKGKRNALLKDEVKIHQDAVTALEKKLRAQERIRDAAKQAADEAERELAAQKKIAKEGMDELKGLGEKFGGAKFDHKGQRIGLGQFKLSSAKLRKEFREMQAQGALPEGVKNLRDFRAHVEQKIKDAQNQVRGAVGKGRDLAQKAQDERQKEKEAAQKIEEINDRIAKAKKQILELQDKLLDKEKKTLQEITDERIKLEKALALVRQNLQGAKPVKAPDVAEVLKAVGLQLKGLGAVAEEKAKTPLETENPKVWMSESGVMYDSLTGEILGMKDGIGTTNNELTAANTKLADIRESIERFSVVNQ